MFIERLKQNDIERFFRQNGYKGEVSWNPDENMVTLGTPREFSYTKIYLFDTFVVSRGYSYDYTTGDWQLFLREVFGDEYMKLLKIKDVPNPFVDRLSMDDFLEIVPFYEPYSIEECNALQKGTRRFKVRPSMDSYAMEVVVGPYFEVGNIQIYGAKKEKFLNFMVKKFGYEYFEWLQKNQP